VIKHKKEKQRNYEPKSGNAILFSGIKKNIPLGLVFYIEGRLGG